MATFVSLADDSTPATEFVRLMELIINPPADESKEGGPKKEYVKLGSLQKLSQQGKHAELIQKGCLDHAATIFASSEESIEAVFTVVFSLLGPLLERAKKKATGLEAHVDLVTSLADLLMPEPLTAPVLKLQLLTLLFNILEESWPLRFQILLRIVKFSRGSNQAGLLVGAFTELPAWITAWKLTSEEQRGFYQDLSHLMLEAKQTEAQEDFRYKYLCTLDGEDVPAAAIKASAKEAANAVRSALKAATSHDFDRVMKLAAVQALAKSKTKEHKLLLQLLKIFSSGRIAEYVTFAETHKAFLLKEGLDPEQQLSLMRTLTLCEMGLVQDTLSYSSVQEALGLKSAAEVEEAVIEAVVSKRLSAKLNQHTEQVIIERATRRGFASEDWDLLGDQLERWKANVSSVLNTLQSSGGKGGEE